MNGEMIFLKIAVAKKNGGLRGDNEIIIALVFDSGLADALHTDLEITTCHASR